MAWAVVDALLYQREVGHLRVYAYVLMPDHLHAAVSVVDEAKPLVDVVRDFKAYTNRLAWRHGAQGELWQRSFYDHVVRREEDLCGICEYILANPVRKGLTKDAHGWAYAGVPDEMPI